MRSRAACVLLAIVGVAVPLLAQEGTPAAGDPGRSASDGGTPPAEIRLDVDVAVALAVKNNLALRAALLDEEIERAKIREALGAFDPVLFGEIGAGRQEVLFPANFPLDPSDPNSPTVTRIISQKAETARGNLGVRGILETGLEYEFALRSDYSKRDGSTGLNPIYNNSTGLTLTQPLLRSAWSDYGRSTADLARLSTLSARETWRGALRDKVREVQGAYYALVFAIADLEVKQKSLELAEQQVALTRVRVESGALPRIETTSAESGRAGRRADVVTAEAAIVENEDRLRRLVLDFEDPSDWERRLLPTERPREDYVELLPLDRIVALAERTEPNLLRAHLAVAQATIVLSQRERESLPKLDLTGNAELVGLDNEFFDAQRLGFSESKGAASWNLGVRFEVPLGNRAASARVAAGELAVKKARIQLKDARVEATYRIRGALRNIDVARRSILARKEATRLAAEQLDNERLRLELKASTNFAVFQVEDQLNVRRTEEVRALLDYRLALLELSRVAAAPLSELIVQH